MKLLKIINNTILFLLLFSTLSFTQQDSITVETDSINVEFTMTKSPLGAVIRSAVVPGWGQYYNESYWKIPIVVGLVAYYGYKIFDFNDKYNQYKQWTLNPPREGFDYKTWRDYYRDQRDLFIIYTSLVYLANLLDAYVDAHLFDFDVTQDYYTNTPMLSLKINF